MFGVGIFGGFRDFPMFCCKLGTLGSARSAVCVAGSQYTGTVYRVLSGKRVPQTLRLILCVIDQREFDRPFFSPACLGYFLAVRWEPRNTTDKHSLIYKLTVALTNELSLE